MKLNLTKFHKSVNSVWGNRALYWEVEFDYDFTDIMTYINNGEVEWNSNSPQGASRLSLNVYDPKLNEFRNMFLSLKNDIIDSMWKDASIELNDTLYKGKEYYKEHTDIGFQIYKDLPGFSMTPHLDNHHILFQLIINMVDNETGTRLFNPISDDRKPDDIIPFYKMTGEKNKGLLFFNNIMSPHDISGITKDRYILYSSINFR